MKFSNLKIFCDIVRLESFSKAASENGISQSGASQVVLQLEEHLGVRLIDRSKRPFVLTLEGEVFYDGCRSLVDRYAALEDRVRTLHDEVAGRLRVASIYSVGLHHMNRHLFEFMSRYPRANVRLEYLHPHRVYESVENDKTDLGLVSYPKSSRTIQALPWREEPMVLVCAPGHALASKARIDLADLAGQRMVGFETGLTIRREIDRLLHVRGVEVEMAMEFDNIETIKRAVEIDAGVALLPAPTVVREIETGTLRGIALATDELVRPLGIIYRRGRELSSTAQRFIELLQQEEGAVGQADKVPVATGYPGANGEDHGPGCAPAPELAVEAAAGYGTTGARANGTAGHGPADNGQSPNGHAKKKRPQMSRN
ncbi:MAG: LysR family transcriptional regulator [Pirellulales bacterium]|nr:LysR family transcriptional regulator [Pirellulales bacterium]